MHARMLAPADARMHAQPEKTLQGWTLVSAHSVGWLGARASKMFCR